MIGTEYPRVDAYGKVTGAARYAEDFYPAGCLHGAIVRSTVASAVVQRIDTDAALALPGVVCVLTAADLPDRLWGEERQDEPVLARDEVRYVGEPVALVAATSKAIASAAAARVHVELEPRPALTTIEAALADDAPQVEPGSDNASPVAQVEYGDLAAARRSAAHVVETVHRSQRMHQGYIEPRAAVAQLEDGRLHVTTTSQAPFVVRQGLAALFDLPLSDVTVRVPTLGGGFGGKLHLGVAPHAVALSLHTGRPVQVVCSRADEMQAGAPRENSTIRLRSHVDGDGQILARDAEIHLDSGAYARDTPHIGSLAALQACGPSAIGAASISVHAVATHTTPTGSMRGPSGPQMVYATEMHLEEVAARIGKPIGEVRRRHLVRDGDRGVTGQRLEHPAIAECVQAVDGHLARWREDPYPSGGESHVRGYGLACAWWCTSPGPSGVVISMDDDGRATVSTGATEIGTGAVASGLPAVVAHALGIGTEQVVLVSGRTDVVPFDAGSAGSRTLYGAGNAALRAAAEVKDILAKHAADELEANPADMVFERGQISVAGSPARAIPLGEVVAHARGVAGPVFGGGRFQAAPPAGSGNARNMFFETFNLPTYHCHGVEIDVDVATGRIVVLRYVAAHDIGTVLNPLGARGQIEGGVVQGIGYALYEEVQTDDAGVVRNDSLVDYRLPTICDAPREIHIEFVDSDQESDGPLGAKGIGEAPVILPAAAIGSALRDAVGVAPDELPLSAPRVLDVLAERPPR